MGKHKKLIIGFVAGLVAGATVLGGVSTMISEKSPIGGAK